jgi:protein involved in polysaccharide export with SLBB domain
LRHKNIAAYIPHLWRWCGRNFAANTAVALIGCILLAGCDPVPKSQPNIIQSLPQSAILSSQTETLTPDELRQVSDTSANNAYVLGPDDQISVYVYLHPELDVPTPNAGSQGALITSDGTVGLPLIGNIRLGGLTLPQAQAALTNAYATYVTDP